MLPAELHSHRVSPADLLACEELLGACIRPFIADLYMTGGEALIGYICRGQHDNIAEIVASSSELTVAPGVLGYAGNAVFDVEWGAPPAVTLPMEFRHAALTAAFRVTFGAETVGVELTAIQFRHPAAEPREDLARFVDVIAETWFHSLAPAEMRDAA